MPRLASPHTYRMRFLWPDEIDAERCHMAALKRKWVVRHGSFDQAAFNEALDDSDEAWGSIYWVMPERVPCIELTVRDQGEMLEEAWRHWQEGPRPEGVVGYVVFDYQFKDWITEQFDSRTETTPESFKELLPMCRQQRLKLAEIVPPIPVPSDVRTSETRH